MSTLTVLWEFNPDNQLVEIRVVRMKGNNPPRCTKRIVAPSNGERDAIMDRVAAWQQHHAKLSYTHILHPDSSICRSVTAVFA
jgi:hypothetical protein